MRKLRVLFWILWVGGGFCGCRFRSTVSPFSLPPSLEQRNLAAPDTSELSSFLLQWHGRDWRAHFAQGLASDDSSERLAEFTQAVRLHPGEPFLLYLLSLEQLARHVPEGDSLALAFLDAALARDPQNGILDLTRSVALTRLGMYARARAVFMDTRGFPRGDFYASRMEGAVLGLLDTGLRLNPYDLIAAQDWMQKKPQPPIEEWSRSLETIFLDPLAEHPYDIRIRGYQAALGLYRLGSQVIAGSLRPDRVFSDGREERLLGLMLQVKAREFLQHYREAFGIDSERTAEWNSDPVPRLQVALREAGSLPGDWDHFLSAWESLGQSDPTLTLGQAAQRLRGETVWRKVMRKAMR